MAQQIQKRLGNVTIEDARVIFRNFSGVEGTYNRAGDRNFNVILPPELAEQMEEDGWNVKYLKPREEGDEPTPRIEVKVKYSKNPRSRPPRVVMITSRGRTPLGEDEVGILDWAPFQTVDLIIRPYQWEVNGRTGVSAYLQSIFVTIEEDELEKKYADVPDSAQASIGGRDEFVQITDGNEIVLDARDILDL